MLHLILLALVVSSALAQPSWTLLNPKGTLPPPRVDHQFTAVGSSLIVTLGFQRHMVFYDDVWRINYTQSAPLQWEQLKSVAPTSLIDLPRADHISFPFGNKVVTYAGINASWVLGEVLIYDIPSQTWTVVNDNPPPEARYGHSAVTTPDGQSLIYGGSFLDGSTTSELWLYDPSTNSWKQLNPANPPPERMWHVSAMVDDYNMIIWGGQSWDAATSFYSDMWVYNLQSNTWKQIQTSFPSPGGQRAGSASVGCNGKMYTFGGSTSGDTPSCTNDLWMYSLTNNTWSVVNVKGTSPDPLCGHKGAWIKNGNQLNFIVFGGCKNPCGPSTIQNSLWQITLTC
eukprot:TRINITY_DN10446_c0_g1_i1.p1 TRINITY_DN10446_c0_g1~~TRINITY_DN10446_c0_g1_i1.p1  ORF type:complete len:341 (-),score=59.86 TRINITY_DN10446_c0_g1_i1:33-1055(-)